MRGARTSRGSAGADDGAGGLGERRAADVVESVKAARPQDHHEIGTDAFGRDEMRVGDRRHDELGNAQREGGGDVEREIGAHRAAERQHPVDAALRAPFAGDCDCAFRHPGHGVILVAAADQLRQRRLRGGGHDLIGDFRVQRSPRQHADVHEDDFAACFLDAIPDERQLGRFCIGRANQKYARLAAHVSGPVSSFRRRRDVRPGRWKSGGRRRARGRRVRAPSPRLCEWRAR